MHYKLSTWGKSTNSSKADVFSVNTGYPAESHVFSFNHLCKRLPRTPDLVAPPSFMAQSCLGPEAEAVSHLRDGWEKQHKEEVFLPPWGSRRVTFFTRQTVSPIFRLLGRERGLQMLPACCSAERSASRARSLIFYKITHTQTGSLCRFMI